MRKLHNIAAILAATIALAGCGATGVKVSDAQVAAFKPGETTEAQVAALLGQPNMRTRLPDGTVMVIYSLSLIHI